MLDTSEDIKQRKLLAINAANRIQAIFDNKKLTPETKMTAFRAYIKPIFLQNCENWTITSSQVEKIQCIPAKTAKNICAKCEMAKYCQK